MRRRLLLTLMLLPVLLAVFPASAQDETTATLVSDDGVSVTIYNEGTALVQDKRTFAFGDGLNLVNFTDVAASIDSTSVSFHSLSDPTGTSVLEQNYVYDLVDASALLNRYIDETIEVTMQDGTVYSGTLLASDGYAIILRMSNGSVVTLNAGLIRNTSFPGLPDGLITRPTLRWLLNSSAGGNQQVELTYLTGGINWSADYIILLAQDNASLNLNGWVTLSNSSGTAYENAKVKLIAGDLNRIYDEEQYGRFDDLDRGQSEVNEPAPQTSQRDFSEYKLYEINRPVTIGNNETKQVEFVTKEAIPAHTFYVYDASPYYYDYGSPITDQYYSNQGVTNVQNYLEFTTTTPEDTKGVDLPAGRIRVYQEDVDGSALLIGENSVDHTPGGETIQLYLGNAFDLVGEHTQTNYVLGYDTLTETYEIHLRNRKDTGSVEVRVPEHLFRWSNWEITDSDIEYTKLDSNTIEFRPTVAAGQETIITYTVKYTFPR